MYLSLPPLPHHLPHPLSSLPSPSHCMAESIFCPHQESLGRRRGAEWREERGDQLFLPSGPQRIYSLQPKVSVTVVSFLSHVFHLSPPPSLLFPLPSLVSPLPSFLSPLLSPLFSLSSLQGICPLNLTHKTETAHSYVLAGVVATLCGPTGLGNIILLPSFLLSSLFSFLSPLSPLSSPLSPHPSHLSSL